MTRWLALLLAFAPSAVAAADAPVLPVKDDSYMAGGPYCGIFAVFGALKAEGFEPQIDTLVQARYVGSELGSSIVELETAARDHGAHSLAIEGMTSASLRSSRHPIVLHVRRPGHGTTFGHWVLFLGCEGDDALILDAPHSVERMPMTELLAHWDGIGLVVSREPIAAVSYSWVGWFEGALVLAVLLGGFALLKRWAGTPRRGIVRFLGRIISLIVLAGLTALAWNLVGDEGFFTNRTAVEHVAVRYFQPKIATIAMDEVESEIGHPGVTIVDARYPGAYQAGHLPDAVSLPISASLTLRRQVIADIPRGNKIIVYCQSESCPWSHSIASDLALRGFRDVVVYPGGWEEWNSRGRRTLTP